MIKKIIDFIMTPYKPPVLTEEVKTIDNRITNMSNKHTLYQWHNDIYMDINGYTYEVKRKSYGSK